MKYCCIFCHLNTNGACDNCGAICYANNNNVPVCWIFNLDHYSFQFRLNPDSFALYSMIELKTILELTYHPNLTPFDALDKIETLINFA